MSGTSLDGIDVAIVDLRGRGASLKLQTVAFHTVPYPAAVRAALAGVSNTLTHTGAISRLNFLLGELYAEAIVETCRRKRVPLESIDLCGMHGQTIYHEGAPADFLGRKVASTLQIGEAAVVAERTGLLVISNFRERDIAAGGTGAPLVPFVDHLLFRKRAKVRAMVNIGGIANLTLLSGASDEERSSNAGRMLALASASAAVADGRFGAKPPSSPTLVLWPAFFNALFNVWKISAPARKASLKLSAPTGMIMNS